MQIPTELADPIHFLVLLAFIVIVLIFVLGNEWLREKTHYSRVLPILILPLITIAFIVIRIRYQ